MTFETDSEAQALLAQRAINLIPEPRVRTYKAVGMMQVA
jgi:hypothetical protein